jgi:hypothetical protein
MDLAHQDGLVKNLFRYVPKWNFFRNTCSSETQSVKATIWFGKPESSLWIVLITIIIQILTLTMCDSCGSSQQMYRKLYNPFLVMLDVDEKSSKTKQ